MRVAAALLGLLLGLLVGLLVAGRGGVGAGTPEEDKAVRDAFLDRLVPIVRAGIARADTEHVVFHGNVDWHSAVHGHWALLRVARVTGRHAEAAADADRSLAPEGLAKEAAYLDANPAFEMPYGRAWFLRLAIEHDTWSRATGGKDPERLRPMAEKVARSLTAWFEDRKPSPESYEYANEAWALAQMHAWATFTKDDAGRARVAGIVQQRFLGDATAIGFGEDQGRPEFFSRFGNWAYLVVRTQDKDAIAAFLAKHPVADADLAPVEPGAKDHHLGMNWSRAWALASLAAAVPEGPERTRLRTAFSAHVAAGIRTHDLRAGDFRAYDHWVPQFAVYALTDGS